MLYKTYTFETAETNIKMFQREGMIFIADMESGDSIAIEPEQIRYLIDAAKALEIEAGLFLEEDREEE